MQSLQRSGYTAAQVIAALHAPNRQLSFRYDLLDGANAYKRAMTEVLAASVANNSLADIKRTARFTLRDTGTINFLNDRIKPYVRLKMAVAYTSVETYFLFGEFPAEFNVTRIAHGYAEFPQGVFLLSTPERKTDNAGVVTCEVEAYDLLQVLVDDKVAARYTVAASANYITALAAVLTGAGLTAQNLTATTLTLPTARDWAPGTTKLRIINDLLGAINYRSLWMDENGVAVAEPYVSPATEASEYTYQDDDLSILAHGVARGLDLFGIPNKWVLTVSQPDRAALTSTYTNTSVTSPTSTVNRGRTIVDFRDNIDAADQVTLDALASRLALEASQAYEHLDFETAIMPAHSEADVLTVIYSPLGINAKYAETGWSMELRAGAKERHQARRVITV